MQIWNLSEKSIEVYVLKNKTLKKFEKNNFDVILSKISKLKKIQ